VPRTFTALIASALRGSMEKTEAVCRTASHPRSACSTAAGAVASPRAVSPPSIPSGSSAAGMLAGDLARTRIRCPARASAAVACEPTYPVPPVTSTSNAMHPQTSSRVQPPCVGDFSPVRYGWPGHEASPESGPRGGIRRRCCAVHGAVDAWSARIALYNGLRLSRARPARPVAEVWGVMAEPPTTSPPVGAAPEREVLVATKLYVPPPGFVPRPRLLEHLAKGVGRGLTVVCTRAGLGKPPLSG